MIDFYAQMNGEKVDENDIAEFEAAFEGAYVKKEKGFRKKGKLWMPK